MSRDSEDDEDMKEFREYIKKWALKKVQKLEKKLKYYAEIYFGEPITIVYVKKNQNPIEKAASAFRRMSDEVRKYAGGNDT